MWRRADAGGGTTSSGPVTARALLLALLAAVLVTHPLAGGVSAAPVVPPPGEAEASTGRPLAELLRTLQREGVPVVFTEALVTAEMRVPEEVAQEAFRELTGSPGSGRGGRRSGLRDDAPKPEESLEERLAELLAPHGLGVRPTGGGALLVVAARGPGNRRSDSPAATVPAADPEAAPAGAVSEEIVVTPSRLALFGEDEPGDGHQTLSRAEVDRMPHLADDLFRLVGLLPGSASGDISAHSYLRGGDRDELLVLVDGLEVYEPFHLRDFQSPFSIVDSEIVGRVDLIAGGFPVEYGGRMSGVLDVETAEPTGPFRGSAGVSVVNARLAGEKAFETRPGGWLVSARGGYLDYVLDVAAEDDSEFELSPSYYDVFGKLRLLAGERTTVSLQVLGARDELLFRDTEDPDETSRADATYGNGYLWLDAASRWSGDLSSRTVLSVGTVERDRAAGVADGSGSATCTTCLEHFSAVRDERSFDFAGLRQDWSYAVPALGRRHLLKWGLDLRRLDARYAYRRNGTVLAPLLTGEREPVEADADVRLSPSGDDLGLYLADRFRLGDRLTVEAGLRWDRESYTDDAGRASPRLHLLWDVGPATRVRATWGRYSQAQGIHELQIEDGVDRFARAQRAEHRVLALEHRFGRGLSLRAEAYEKRLSRLRSRYENLFEPIDLIPEAAPDRVRIAPERGRARGLELLLKQAPAVGESPRRFQWWASYVLSSVDDVVDGREIPRSWDQTHAVTLGANLRLGPRWNLNAVWLYHTGWPTTRVDAELEVLPDGTTAVVPRLGPRNGERFPDFHRLDLRAARVVTLESGTLSLFVEVTNLYDRRNVRAVSGLDYRVRADGGVEVVREEERWLPRIPSFGVSWSF